MVKLQQVKLIKNKKKILKNILEFNDEARQR